MYNIIVKNDTNNIANESVAYLVSPPDHHGTHPDPEFLLHATPSHRHLRPG
ncbi:hypothetical protein PF005_g21292 [Phytophthora fragariae]|uniref:Uncharacterized protein n=1 Tax=Phytophthora fragariae TaxID=53985 RepID=A0A6A3IYF0_9STRA|nr:hypothetical protein PF003_g41034 [Phytophthora fragariae]KAE8927561.1 hypothetical protein PF009_g22271 [Phytophthora fragariae]KAE8986757.1 hypothetical protein PF011_g19864 [Phytophthora fragariae]KAE9076920.1 hypothetical protein PF010_g23707 [Phytophthora fragariae]KAE9084112.1 hypothetical protein PF007_g21640 [Phytophthora fragariae]